jgi:hypothetical protein
MTHHVADPTTGLRPMTYGRAMHMDLSRASDADLDRAFRVLNDYDDAGKASAYTQDEIDDRIDDINCEGDRRAGVTYAVVDRKPRSFWHPATTPVNADDADASADEGPAELANDGAEDEDAAMEDAENPSLAGVDAEGATAGPEGEVEPAMPEAVAEAATDAVDGLVPGETSSM